MSNSKYDRFHNIVGDWDRVLYPILSSRYFKGLMKTLQQEYKDKTIYPDKSNIFRAFKECPYEDLKVLIIGQDPFHDGSATGLCFANKESKRPSPSLKKILEQIEISQYEGMMLDKDPTLEHWPKQGILMINSALTVERKKPGSHAKLWEQFTISTLERLSEINSGIIYMLWGNYAKAYKKYINTKSNYVLEYHHPAYSARQGKVWECPHFEEANQILINNHNAKIKW